MSNATTTVGAATTKPKPHSVLAMKLVEEVVAHRIHAATSRLASQLASAERQFRAERSRRAEYDRPVLADAAAGVSSLGPLIKVGVAALVILSVMAVLIDGSSMNVIRRVREQRKADAHSAEAAQVNRPGDA